MESNKNTNDGWEDAPLESSKESQSSSDGGWEDVPVDESVKKKVPTESDGSQTSLPVDQKTPIVSGAFLNSLKSIPILGSLLQEKSRSGLASSTLESAPIKSESQKITPSTYQVTVTESGNQPTGEAISNINATAQTKEFDAVSKERENAYGMAQAMSKNYEQAAGELKKKVDQAQYAKERAEFAIGASGGDQNNPYVQSAVDNLKNVIEQAKPETQTFEYWQKTLSDQQRDIDVINDKFKRLDPSLGTSYGEGALKSYLGATTDIYRSMAGASRLLGDITNNPTFWVGEHFINNVANGIDKDWGQELKDVPDNLLGDMVAGGASMIPSLLTAELVPTISAGAKIAELTGGVVKTVPKFGISTGLLQGSKEYGLSSGDEYKALEETAKGFTEGSIMHALGFVGGKGGELAEKMGANLLASSLSKGISTGAAFSGYDYLTGENDPRKLAAAFGMGAAFSLPEIAKALHERAVDNFNTADPNLIRQAHDIKMPVEEMRNKVIDISEQIKKEENPKKKQELVLVAEALNKMADLKSITNDVLMDPAQKTNDIINDPNLTPEEKQYFVNHIKTVVEENDPRIKEAQPLTEEIKKINQQKAFNESLDLPKEIKDGMNADLDVQLKDLTAKVDAVFKQPIIELIQKQNGKEKSKEGGKENVTEGQKDVLSVSEELLPKEVGATPLSENVQDVTPKVEGSAGAGDVEVKEGFTEGGDLNRIFAESKTKYGEKDGNKYNDAANRLVNPNTNTIIEVRSNGVVVKEGGKYLLKPFTNTDANYKKWELAKPLDVTDQYVKSTSISTEEQPKKETNAIQEPSTTEILPREQGEIGKTGGEPQGVGQVEQGTENADQGKEEKKVEPVGMTKEAIKSQRVEMGLPELEKQVKTEIGERFDKVKSDIDSGIIDPIKVADDILTGKHAATPEQKLSIGIKLMESKAQFDDIAKELESAIASENPERYKLLSDALNNADQQVTKLQEANDKSQTDWGRFGRYSQVLVGQDRTLHTLMVRAKAAEGGSEVPDEIKKQITDLKNKYDTLKSEADKREAETKNELLDIQKKYQDLFSSVEKDKALRAKGYRLEAEIRKEGRTERKEVIRKKRQESFLQIKEILKGKPKDPNEPTVVQNSLIPLTQEQIIELTPHLASIFEGYIKEGSLTVAQIVDDMVKSLKEIHPGVTHEDISEALGIKVDIKEELKKIESLSINELNSKIERSLTRSIDELEKQLKSGNFRWNNKSEKIAATEKIAELKQKQADLKKKIELAKDIKIEQEQAWDKVNDVIKDIQYENRPLSQKIKDNLLEAVSLPKSLMASADFSAPLRQGAILGAGNPTKVPGAMREMFRQAFSEKKANKWMYDLKMSPEYKLIKQSDLYLSEDTHKLTDKEEAFMTNIAQKIPVWGKIVKGSERAYAAYLNKLRVDVFASGADNFNKSGLTPEKNPEVYKAWADFINNSTGRGNLGRLENSAVVLNSTFFSPRLIASRFNLLNPATYAKMPPSVRKTALKNMIAYVGLGTTVLALAKAAGADVEDDPRSSDFGKIKVDNTRFDIWAGFQPIVRTIAQVSTNSRKSSATGKVSKLGEGYKADTQADVIENFFRNKLAPIPATTWNFLKGKDATGKEVTIKGEVAKNTIPLVFQDIAEVYKSEDAATTAAYTIPAMFGAGIQTYGSGKEESFKKRYDSEKKKYHKLTKEEKKAKIERRKESLEEKKAYNKWKKDNGLN
jgi:hypothetical protein